MKKTIVSLLALAVLFGLGAAPASGEVPDEATQNTPGMINYQGLLKGPNGTAYEDGGYTFDIRLYREISGGTPVWGGTYATYVKDGYFNIMLGGETGSFLAGCTYEHDELWKALWPDPNTQANLKNTLFLGITPHQDQGAQTIENPEELVELAPRQNLLAAPYAFRAQTAEYANQSLDNFIVNGSLSASYTSGGNHILKAYNKWNSNFNRYIPTVELGLGKVNDNTVLIDTRTLITTTEGEAHTTTGKATLTAGDFDVNSTGPVTIDAATTVNVTGTSGATISGGASALSLEGSSIKGKNRLLWAYPGNPTSSGSPFRVLKQNVSIAQNATSGWADLPSGCGIQDWAAMIVGINGPGSLQRFYMYKSGDKWRIGITAPTPANMGTTTEVTVLLINTHLVSDER